MHGLAASKEQRRDSNSGSSEPARLSVTMSGCLAQQPQSWFSKGLLFGSWVLTFPGTIGSSISFLLSAPAIDSIASLGARGSGLIGWAESQVLSGRVSCTTAWTSSGPSQSWASVESPMESDDTQRNYADLKSRRGPQTLHPFLVRGHTRYSSLPLILEREWALHALGYWKPSPISAPNPLPQTCCSFVRLLFYPLMWILLLRHPGCLLFRLLGFYQLDVLGGDWSSHRPNCGTAPEEVAILR